MTEPADRLFHQLPYVYRKRDAERGDPLRRFLRVIEQQVAVLERDLAQSYDNWFIETCEDWVVPYIAELVGQRPLAPVGPPGVVQRAEGQLLRRTLAPRVDVASAMAHARRKGTLPVLEELARVVAGWPARAVEGTRRVAFTQPIRHLRLERGRTLGLRDAGALAQLGGPFDESARTVDVRRPSAASQGLASPHSVGVFVFRLRAFPVTYCEPYLHEGGGAGGRGCYWFNVLGFDTPLFVRPQPEPDPYKLAGPEHLPVPLTGRMLERDLRVRDPRSGAATPRGSSHFYGESASLCIWLDRGAGLAAVPPDRIIPCDLSNWKYAPEGEQVLVDPERGRFKVAGRVHAARVSYQTGFSAALGGGEYDRELTTPREAHKCYRVGPEPGDYTTLADALSAWETDMSARRAGNDTIPPRAVIEISAHGIQRATPPIVLGAGETLVVRAADRQRAVLWLADNQPEASDALHITGAPGCRFVLDGVLVAQRGLEARGAFDQFAIRHCTLPRRGPDVREGSAATLVLGDVTGEVRIERSIVGPISVSSDAEPVRLHIADSIVDAGADEEFALSGDGEGELARATLEVRNATFFGGTAVHAIALAENGIFTGAVQVARRQPGCMRFCYVPEGSRTPRRHHCEPDRTLEALRDASDEVRRVARDRVRPMFSSRRFGAPGFAQLHAQDAPALKRGADDESELGAFHDLYQPQRSDALDTRLDEHTPVAIDAGIFFAT